MVVILLKGKNLSPHADSSHSVFLIEIYVDRFSKQLWCGGHLAESFGILLNLLTVCYFRWFQSALEKAPGANHFKNWP